ncbi:hypothetical protein C8E03_1452 [Lachnotalea glycerini]|uniref:Uncharacterized protein n=1 Tax=Lachnotalea glycerini TaxID=1763509 RepID=A0A318EKF9_9FIRM|nr:hypothetical protein [Lachnotalea glycerini]PXV83705.1 hypothetical protein C8E03_1452 [Lachnotalea glycerini]
MIDKIIQDNDIYFIDVVENKIIVNDNYEGVLIYDLELDLIKNMKLFEDIVIYSSFILGKNEIMLFCPENGALVYINVEKYISRVISLSDEQLSDIVIVDLYAIKEEGGVFVDSNNEFIEVAWKEESVNKIEISMISEKYQKTNDKKKSIEQIQKSLIESYDYININTLGKITDIVYENEIVLYNGEKKITMQPVQNYTFNNAKIIKNDNLHFLVILSNCKNDIDLSIITIVCIETLMERDKEILVGDNLC